MQINKKNERKSWESRDVDNWFTERKTRSTPDQTSSEKFKQYFVKGESRKASSGLQGRHALFKESGSSFGYANAAARKSASVGEHFTRAAIFGTAGSGMKRETLMNSIGLLTKHQKAEVKASGAGFFAKSQKWLIPGGALLALGANAADGGGLADFVGGFIAPEIGARIGINVGKNLGFGVSKALGGNLMAGGVIGGTIGTIGGLAIGAAVGYIGAESADSNNLINQQAYDMNNADFHASFDVNNNTLTHKQRAMNKLSKSALNDRGVLLGNEAAILAGVL